ncbi:MAG: polynucleotide adenylyltransferase PcnB [Sandaracinaceae bacterium]|nr:polynucleotide adenylyltransferase PcnB [Sandaracinaceae bacterium]
MASATPPPEALFPDAPEPAVYDADVRPDDVDPDALKVIRRLRRSGYQAYLVGGGVRDLLLNAKPKDFDIATSARPNEVRSLFRNCRIIGRRFRLAHILFGGGKIIETATFRRDPSADDDDDDARRREDVDLLIRHDNVFGEPWEDAMRRDFTINGLFYDSEANTVIDYVGGMPDIRGRVVRTIGQPDVRFREDPVRILRAIKFSARLDLGIDPPVYDAMVAQRDELARAARPRLLEEILRLLRGGAAHRSFWLMWETGALGVLLPQVAMHLDDGSPDSRRLWGRLDAIDTLRRAGSLPTDAVLFSALLLGPIEEAVDGVPDATRAYEALMQDVVETLAVPRRLKERVRTLVQAQRRMRAGKMGALPRREYFDEASTLLSLESHARGERIPDWLGEETDDDTAPRPRTRRRRRRRRAPE